MDGKGHLCADSDRVLMKDRSFAEKMVLALLLSEGALISGQEQMWEAKRKIQVACIWKTSICLATVPLNFFFVCMLHKKNGQAVGRSAGFVFFCFPQPLSTSTTTSTFFAHSPFSLLSSITFPQPHTIPYKCYGEDSSFSGGWHNSKRMHRRRPYRWARRHLLGGHRAGIPRGQNC